VQRPSSRPCASSLSFPLPACAALAAAHALRRSPLPPRLELAAVSLLLNSTVPRIVFSSLLLASSSGVGFGQRSLAVAGVTASRHGGSRPRVCRGVRVQRLHGHVEQRLCMWTCAGGVEGVRRLPARLLRIRHTRALWRQRTHARASKTRRQQDTEEGCESRPVPAPALICLLPPACGSQCAGHAFSPSGLQGRWDEGRGSLSAGDRWQAVAYPSVTVMEEEQRSLRSPSPRRCMGTRTTSSRGVL
jgi:hypothetical protein